MMTVSLPSWECGLKFSDSALRSEKLPSLPSWECGLKLKYINALLVLLASLPSWECGLKLYKFAPMRKIGESHSLRGSVD